MSGKLPEDRPRPLTAWLRLLRLPNVFTAWADVTMGYLVADGQFNRLPIWITLLLATGCMYLAGMVLNDVFDLELDRRERPERPLPAGWIAVPTAIRAGALLWLVGMSAAWAVHLQARSPAPFYLSPAAMGSLLGTCVLLYDAKFKSTVFGPLLMGGCRAANVWMGMSIAADPSFHQSRTPIMIAGAIGLYVMGITWFARHEADDSPRITLVSGLVLMLIGVALLTAIPLQNAWPRHRVTFASPWIWPLLVWLMTSTVWRRALTAIYSLRSSHIQVTVKQAILTLIVIDAVVVLVVAGPFHALGILALAFPASYLSRYIAMT